VTTRHATARVTVAGLTKRFGDTVAVDGIDLTLTGGVVGLLGPNGAGKTTVLRMLATVLAPDSGRLDILGYDPATPAERLEIRRRLGYLPQNPELYPSFTAFDLVDYVAVLKEHADRRRRRLECLRVLELVGLAGSKDTKIRELSGGMRQRLALAAALVGDPDLLVLDEPAGGLDPEQRLELRSMLSTTAARGAVVMSTHNTAEVAALCQTVVVMAGGAVRFSGSPDDLRHLAVGRVWESDRPAAEGARSWLTPQGLYRHLGTAPADVSPATPTLEDGYLLAIREPA